MTIGTQANANFVALNITKDNVHAHVGWTFLASGSYREAYLGPDKVVYKVPSGGMRFRSDYNAQQDRHEGVNYDIIVTKLLENNVEGWEVVEATGYVVRGDDDDSLPITVVAQRLAPGKREDPGEYCLWSPQIDPPTDDAYFRTSPEWDAYYRKREGMMIAHRSECERCISHQRWNDATQKLESATGYWDVHCGNYNIGEDGTRYLFDYGGRLN